MESTAKVIELKPNPAPHIQAVPSVSQDHLSTASSRMTLLGGPTMPALPTFTLSNRLHGRHLLTDTDLTADEVLEVIDTASRLKSMHKKGQPHHYLTGKSIGMIFQLPSTRTRVSLEAGMAQLGGQAIFLGLNDLQVSRGETIADTAQILSRYVDAVVARVYDHTTLLEIGSNATIPVMNGLSDRVHPLQAWADMLTLQEKFGQLKGLKIAYLGDGNNMVASLMLTGAALGVSVVAATPEEYAVDPTIVQHAQWIASGTGASITTTTDPWSAVKGVDVVYTDVHSSMGQETSPHRAVTCAPYKVTPEIMQAAGPQALFMHCLPMHRDEEVCSLVVDSPQSIIFDQAENRLHMHKALLVHTLC